MRPRMTRHLVTQARLISLDKFRQSRHVDELPSPWSDLPAPAIVLAIRKQQGGHDGEPEKA